MGLSGILIGDERDACLHLGWECLVNQSTRISRLRLDGCLFANPAPVPAGRRGRMLQKSALDQAPSAWIGRARRAT